MLLPSGYRVRGVVPGLQLLARRGLLDMRVQQAVVGLVAREYLAQADETSAPDTDALQLTLDAVVAGFPVEAQDPGADPETGEWKDARLSLDDLERMDQRDRLALQMLVLHVRTADEITAASEQGDEEGPGEMDSLADFRDDPRGPKSGADGEGVEPATVGAAAGG